MGIDCELSELFSFTYREILDNGLTGHEYDHVFFGLSKKDPVINVSEVSEWSAVAYQEMCQDLKTNPLEIILHGSE